ncbi:hypothetical protein [Lacticaseibacillus porcinae]|uniref:hypothetical protein n=1 Tax=Lacticaseibacillus porcinae TaxID=1123687 RepID=UPI0017830B38|nr:hypothetical protein [Lacticaseibacillus porcinae]
MKKLVNDKLFNLFPFIFGGIILLGAYLLWKNLGMSYSNIKGYSTLLSSLISFLSIIIGFYSAFYGIIISLSKSKVMVELTKSKYNGALPKLLFRSLGFSFLGLMINMSMQVLVHYKNTWILGVYFCWSFVTGVFLVYAFQTALLSIAMIFYSDPEKIQKDDLEM